MPTFGTVRKTCSSCGHGFEVPALTSTNSFGSPDLDLRPSEMMRSTMPTWITKCPKCGYIRDRIEMRGKRHRAFIRSKEYLTCEGAKLSSGLSRDFYKYALILLREHKRIEAYDAFVYAAWAADDLGNDEEAILCRNKAIALYRKRWFMRDPDEVLIQVDLLRRVGRFADAISLCKSMKFKDEQRKKVARFQIELSAMKDTGCYCVEDCGLV